MNLKNFELVCLIIFLALTTTLILLKLFKVGNRRRGVIKMLAAFMFVMAGVYGVFIVQSPYCWLLLLGLCFAFIGDLLLVFMDKHAVFIAGVIAFSLASLTFSVYSVLAHGWKWWSLLIFAPLCAVNILLQYKKVFSFGSSVVYLNVYTILVGFCGAFGLSLLCSATSLSMAMFGLGCFMYMASDIVLGLYLFKLRYPVIDAANTALYFPGLFLIAISLIL